MLGRYDHTIDAKGRIIIPAKLREYAHIKKDLVTLGAMNKIEIWSAELREETAGENLMDNPSLTDKLKEYQL
jgi:MraZ protein